MSEDWKPGDLAVCVSAGSRLRSVGITIGSSYVVAEVVLGKAGRTAGKLGLYFAGFALPPGKIGFLASHFRKVRPDQQEPCEEEFTELLNRTRKQVSA